MLTEARNRAIVREFERLCGVREGGVQKYSYAYILKKLTDRFFLSAATLEKIIKKGLREGG